MIRKVYDNEGVVALFYTYFMASLIDFKELNRFIQTQRSFYQFLEKFGIKLSINSEIISALTSNSNLNKQFKLHKNQALLKRERLVKGNGSDYLEYSECFYLTDKYRFIINFTDNAPADIPY